MRERVGAVVVRDRAVLMVTGFGLEGWWTPGGHKEAGETDEEALRRELQEELGVEVAIGDRYCSLVAPSILTGEDTLCTYYRADVSGTAEPRDEISDLGWFSREDFETGTVRPLPAFAEHVLPRLIADSLI